MTTPDYADNNIVSDILDNISTSPSAYHVIKNAAELIDAQVLHESESFWDISKGNTYMVSRNDASSIFFHIPDDIDVSSVRFEIAAVHSDSPGFIVKHEPVIVRDGYVMLNVEEYGSPLRKTWFDRPLSIAGRVIVANPKIDKLETYLVDLRDYLSCVIPSLAPHMGGTDEDKVPVQSTMLPIIGNDDVFACPETCLNDAITAFIRDTYGLALPLGGVIDYDLFLYNMESPRRVGLGEGHMVCSPRLDDQGCVWSAVHAFADMLEKCDEDGNVIPVLVIFDNEENGSCGYHAASSMFLSDTLSRIWHGLSLRDATFALDMFSAALARSFMVSADNGHAHHPNYIAKGDITNPVVCGRGVVLKYAANQKYMTNARSGASFSMICAEENISHQSFHKHSDVKGGSTLGNISAANVSIPGCDIGLAQLAMHSACEWCSADDIVSLTRFFYAFFSGTRDVETTVSEAIYY